MASFCSPCLCTLPFSSVLPKQTPSSPFLSLRNTHLSFSSFSCEPRKPELRKILYSAISGIDHGVSADRKGEGEEDVLIGAKEMTSEGAEEKVKYNWEEEWYPLYLTAQVPDDAPVGLTVFDKQLVLYRDGKGVLRCYEDRCPHRLAKLSEGQLVDGRLECLYHGWQFEDDGRCVKIPQLPASAKLPSAACVKSYELRDSQGVLWVWMSDLVKPDDSKLPWFENYALPGFQDISSIHELPYDHSILLENLMDPAHVPISHDRVDWAAKREDAQPLRFRVTEQTDRGFAGEWNKEKDTGYPNILRFDAPCVLQNNRLFVDKNGKERRFSGLFLCRPAGQGKSFLIVRFGSSSRSPLLKLLPQWYLHQNQCKVFEQDMGFLSSQNEVLIKEKVPTSKLYLNLKSSDTWVSEYRKWMDKVGHGMPYYFGHSTISPPKTAAVFEHAPAGLVAGISASFPAKGGEGTKHSPNPANRYFRHVVHCRGCQSAVKAFQFWRQMLVVLAIVSAGIAVLASVRQWKTLLLLATTVCLAAAYGCSHALGLITTNFVRNHRRI